MRKAPIWIVALAFISIFSTQISFAAVSPGTKCLKAGATVTSAGKRYICIKSGKKLVWNKGVAIPKPLSTPTVSPTPTPTVSPTPTPTPSPTSSFVEPPAPTSLQDLAENFKGVIYWAWKNTKTQLNSNQAITKEIVVLKGPNTILPRLNDQMGADLVSQLFRNFDQPKKIYTIFYTFQDIDWAQSEFSKVSYKSDGQEAKNNCRTSDTCWGGSGQVDLKGNAISMSALMDLASSNIGHENGTALAHEYFHAIQETQFLNSGKMSEAYCCIKRWIPRWYVEGQATEIATATIFNASYKEYLADRKLSISELLTDPVYTRDWFVQYLSIPPVSSNWDKYRQWKEYDVGSLVLECLVALKGPDTSMQLVKDIGAGMTYEESFFKNYGTTWEEAIPILADTLYKIVSQGI